MFGMTEEITRCEKGKNAGEQHDRSCYIFEECASQVAAHGRTMDVLHQQDDGPKV